MSDEIETVIDKKVPAIVYDRKDFEESIVQMFIDKISGNNFYAHLIAKCKVTMSPQIPTAGVSFRNSSYHLMINPFFFEKLTPLERIDVIKHEMLHVMYRHLTVRDDFANHEQANIAMDMAINQVLRNLPKDCIDYKNFQGFPSGCNTEQYYDLLEKDEDFQEQMKQKQEQKQRIQDAINDALANGQTNGQGQPVDADGNPIEGGSDGVHDWKLSDEEKELVDAITSDMLENAMTKAIGNLPGDLTAMLDLFNKKAQVNWKKELKKLVGHKKANKRLTIKRRDRRMPSRMDLRGKTKDTTFELIVLVDTSGSMSDAEILVPLNEVKHICKMTNTTMKVVQVDTEVSGVSDFGKDDFQFERKGCGGTYMEAGIDYIYKEQMKFDAILFLTDLYIEELSSWKFLPKAPIFWLSATPMEQGSQVQTYPRQKRYLIELDA